MNKLDMGAQTFLPSWTMKLLAAMRTLLEMAGGGASCQYWKDWADQSPIPEKNLDGLGKYIDQSFKTVIYTVQIFN